MEWAAEAKLGAALGFFLCAALHQAVVREHVLHAHLAFDLVKTHPLCHTWYPFVTCVNTVGAAFTVAKWAKNTRPSPYWRGACCVWISFFFCRLVCFLCVAVRVATRSPPSLRMK